MHGKAKTPFRSIAVRLALAAIGVSMLTGCVRTRDVSAPGPGHPANAESSSVAFTPPVNPFASPLDSFRDDGAERPEMDMPGMKHDESGSHGDSGLTVYACPMHADVRSDRPGTCPKCGMTLVPNRGSEQQPHKHGDLP